MKKFIVKDFIIWLLRYKFKMGCRNDCQDSLKLEQFVKNILYRYTEYGYHVRFFKYGYVSKYCIFFENFL